MFFRLTILFLIPSSFFAQDIEQWFKKLRDIRNAPISVRGQMGVNAMGYAVEGIAARRDPFYWMFSSQASINILGLLSVPLSASFSKNISTIYNPADKYRQPFRQFGLSPCYKRLTLHAGYRTMDFSAQTLSGVQFLGGGLELKPAERGWSGAICFGKFAIIQAVTTGNVNRWGGAAKWRLNRSRNFYEAIYTHLRDVWRFSPSDSVPGRVPQESRVLGFRICHHLNSRFVLNGEWNMSVFTRNLLEEAKPRGGFSLLNTLMKVRPGTTTGNAVISSVEYLHEGQRFSLCYKRFDPGYATLGAPYLMNDYEEFSAAGAISVIRKKLDLQSSTGVQRNDLNGQRGVSTWRWVFSGNAVARISEHVQWTSSYANFLSRISPPAQRDSVQWTQVSKTADSRLMIGFGNTSLTNDVQLGWVMQNAVATGQASTLLQQFSASYGCLINKVHLRISSAYQLNVLMDGQVVSGPSFSFQQQLLRNKLRLGANYSLQMNKAGTNLTSNNAANINVQWNLSKQHAFKLDFSRVESRIHQRWTETRVSAGYNYSFAYEVKRK